MEFLKNKKIGSSYTFIGKVISINKGECFYNIDFLLVENININIKFQKKFPHNIVKDQIYSFEVLCIMHKEKITFIAQKYDYIENVLTWEEIYQSYTHFFPCAPVSFHIINQTIENYLNKIKNPILHQITQNLYLKNKKKFLIYPAAREIHHNYYGGLGYHTLTILRLADAFLPIYQYLNADLLYAGIILHDMAKIQEFDFYHQNYTKEGTLLGHLVLGASNIYEEACRLHLQNTEEIMLLQHLIISHHGLLEYGAAKRPQVGEALLLWYLDTIDAKFNTLGEVLQNTNKGEFSKSIPVLEKKMFYKINL